MPELFNVTYNMKIYMEKTFRLHLSASIQINTRVTRTRPRSRLDCIWTRVEEPEALLTLTAMLTEQRLRSVLQPEGL